MDLVPIRFDDAEDGEVEPADEYYPTFEYPRSDEVSQYHLPPRIASPSPPPASATNRTTIFRLIRLHSTVLSRSKRIAALDGHAEVSVGRDVAPSARIRLKEMIVSKFHASIYWDGLRREWGIVDMGSVHGTFVRSARGPSTSTVGSEPNLGTRLSEARKSSMPKVLRHLDEVTIGGTTFLVHEHLTGRPCPECAITDTEEIALFSSNTHVSKPSQPEEDQSRKRKRANDSDVKDPRQTMAQLKSSLMSRHASPGSSSKIMYKDRSALRRELHPEPRVLPSSVPVQPDVHTRLAPPPRVVSPPPSIPPAALPSTNIGHKLLLKQGWSPGMALGENPDDGLVEPLNLSVNTARAGLGSAVAAPRTSGQSPGDWREEAKQRWWDVMRGN